MGDLLPTLIDPALLQAFQHLTSTVDVGGILSTFASEVSVKLGADMTGAFIERIARWGKGTLAVESDQTIATSLQRVGKLYDQLADEIVTLNASGAGVDATHFRAVFDDPQAARALHGASDAAAQTDDASTIGTLAKLLAQRLSAAPGSQLSLRIRQAVAAVEELQLRELYALGLSALVVTQLGVLNRGGRMARDDEDRRDIVSWYEANVPLASVLQPTETDMLQLQAQGMVIQSSRADQYDSTFPQRTSRVHQVWTRVDAASQFDSYPSEAMTELERAELGTDHTGQRAVERAAIGAYILTEAGFLLGIVFLQQLGVQTFSDFSSWSDVVDFEARLD